jgi:hypothetical protein
MQLDGYDLRAAGQQMRGDRAGSGADVEDKVARLDARRCDQPGRPLVSEPMPSPVAARLPARAGHDASRS